VEERTSLGMGLCCASDRGVQKRGVQAGMQMSGAERRSRTEWKTSDAEWCYMPDETVKQDNPDGKGGLGDRGYDASG